MKQLSEITSRNNDRIIFACSLKEKSARQKSGLILLEGIRLLTDAAKSNIEIKEVFLTQKALEKFSSELEKYSDKFNGFTLINEPVALKLSDTKTPQGVFCVCKAFERKPEIQEDGLYVLTDNIQNPDNIGAIVRSAEALGINGIFVCGGCDIYSPKSMRASMGGFLRFPVMQSDDASGIINQLRQKSIRICATVPDMNATDITKADIHGGACLVIGNEGNGISDDVLSLCTDFLTIPMKGNAESLNASAAATIAIWELCR